MKHHFLKFSTCILVAFLSGWFSSISKAQVLSLVAADLAQGYSSKAVSKIVKAWSPPKLLGAFSTEIQISLNGQGQVLGCKTVKSSGMEVFDKVAVSAIYQAQPFGTTPKATPLEIFMVFRQEAKGEKSLDNPPLSDQEALKAEAYARAKFERLWQTEAADAVETRARLRAEEAAKSMGLELDPQNPQPVAARGKNPGTTPVSTLPVSKDPIFLYEQYLQKLTDFLAVKLVFPSRTLTKAHPVTLKMAIGSQGKLLRAEFLQKTGYESLDKAILYKLELLGTFPEPPSEIQGKNLFVVVEPKIVKVTTPQN